MAPEVLNRQNHSFEVDYFAVGVIAYECCFGRRPYVGKSRNEIRDNIESKEI
jgi:serine/threonine protein kinase